MPVLLLHFVFLTGFYIARMKLASVHECVCVQMFVFVYRKHVCLLASDSTARVVIMFVCHPQINGHDVQDREEAMAALSNDECRNIVLLVARPELQVRNDHTHRGAAAPPQPANKGFCIPTF